MKIKIIDLANKIINNELEDGFKVLKDGNVVLVYNREKRMFRSECGNIEFIKFDYFALNKEVEIIEEDKEIEEIEIIDKTEEQMKFYNCTYNKETKEYEFELKDIEIDYLFKNFEGNKGNIYERLDKNFKEIEYYLKALANAVNELKKGK